MGEFGEETCNQCDSDFVLTNQNRVSNDEKRSILEFLHGFKRYSDEDLIETWKFFKNYFGNYFPLYVALKQEVYIRGLSDSSEAS